MTINHNAVALLQKRMRWQQINGAERAPELKVALLGSFTLDMLEPYAGVALEDEGLPSDVWVGPYNQILQECLTPGSRTEAYDPDLLVVVPRLEELWSGRPLPLTSLDPTAEPVDYHHEAKQLADVCLSAAERWGAKLCFVLPPIPEERTLGVGDAGDLDGVVATATAVREALRRQLAGRALIADLDGLIRRLGVERAMNPAMLVFGHIPFSDDLFAELGAEIARLTALGGGFGRRLLAVDGDGVLWGGKLADGAESVDLAAGGPGLAHRHLQGHLLERRQAGLRLALVTSTDDATDDDGAVQAVLDRPEMVVRRDDFETIGSLTDEGLVDGLKELAAACGVGLDEVIWLSADEERRRLVAETKGPAVVAMPEDAARWRLDLAWDRNLDRLPHPSPKTAGRGAGGVSLEAFLAGLGLEVGFEDFGPEAGQTVVDLQQKISEFNLAAAVRTADEVASDLSAGRARALAVRVEDRFDSYGVAGLVRTEKANDALVVDTLLLNCRVLGKRVEAFIVDRLADDAEAAGLERLHICYRPTDRNAPVLDWLKRVDPEGLEPWDDGGSVLNTTVERARSWAAEQRAIFADAGADAGAGLETPQMIPAEEPVASFPQAPALALRRRPASTDLPDDAEGLLEQVRLEKRRKEKGRKEKGRSQGEAEDFVASRTPTEDLLSSIWADMLDRDGIGVYDNFFRLGGHSLLATRILSRVREAFGVELPLKSLFEAPTVAQMAARIDAARRDGSLAASPAIEAVSRDRALPLSFAQRRLLTLDRLEPGSTGYHMQVGIRLLGPLDRPALQEAVDRLVARHESLRTRFVDGDDLEAGEPVQEVLKTLEIPIADADLSGVAPDRRTEAARALADEQLAVPFDLASGRLFRLVLARQGDDDHLLLLTLHHIIGDVWSLGIFFQELMADYETAVHGEPSALPELPVQIPDFASWQRNWMQGDVLETHVDFWRDRLQEAPTLLELPTDRKRPAQLGGRNGRVALELSPELAERIRRLGDRHGATVFMTLFGAFATLLSRWSRQEDLLVGMPIANRTRAELERLIGFVANTLVLRGDLRGDPSFATLLDRVRSYVLEASDYQDMPFETLVKSLRPARDPSRNPLFQVMFAFHNVPAPEVARTELSIESVDLDRGLNPFDMFLHLWERPADDGSGSVLGGSLSYSLDLFEEETARRLVDDFVTVLDKVSESPERPLADLLDGELHPPRAAAGEAAVAGATEPVAVEMPMEAEYVAPRTNLERILVEVWQDVLQRDRIGVDDNFFFVGGDSILALRVIARARQDGLVLVPKQLMRHQTCAELAQVIEGGGDSTIEEPQGPIFGEVGITPSQGFFFELGLDNRDHFNQVFYGELPGTSEDDKNAPEVLAEAFRVMLEQHDTLHLRFDQSRFDDRNGQSTSRYAEQADRRFDGFEVIDLRETPEGDRQGILESTEARVHRAIRLADGPLFLPVLFRLPEGHPDRLLMVVHHIVADAVSWGILMGDLEALCGQIANGRTPALPPKTASLKRWSDTLYEAAKSDEVRSELSFWRDRPWAEAARLPADDENGANIERHVALVSRTLSPEATSVLLRHTEQSTDLDMADLLLATAVEGFSEWTGSRTLPVCLTRNGRHLPWGDLDTSRTIGWLVHIFPVLLELDDSNGLWDAGRLVNKHLSSVPRNGLGFGLLRFLADEDIRRQMAEIPMPQLLFNYFGRVDASGVGSRMLTPIDRGRPEIHDPDGVREFQLIINSLVDDDRLRFNCTFSDQVYRPATLERRLDVLVELLEDLAARLESPVRKPAHPSVL